MDIYKHKESLEWQFKKWQKMILEAEGLNQWTVKNLKIGGGLCQPRVKRIICKIDNRPLFLHEVAHALLPERGHDAVWADIFTELCRRYLDPKRSIIKAWAVIDALFPEHILFYYNNKGSPHLDIHFLREEALKARNKWRKAYKPKAKIIPIEIYLFPKIKNPYTKQKNKEDKL